MQQEIIIKTTNLLTLWDFATMKIDWTLMGLWQEKATLLILVLYVELGYLPDFISRKQWLSLKKY